MPRKVENRMNAAIHRRENWKAGNTEVRMDDDWAEVYLHGNHIATISPTGHVTPNLKTFSRWPTPTTRSRLQALGVNANIRDFQPCIDGKPV